jgi:5'(3')-deoxyribonucleotidase
VIVLLDADGVTVNFVSPALAAVHACGGPKLDHDQLDRWDIDTLLETAAQRAEYWARVTAPGFCTSLEPYPGAWDSVSALRNMGHDVVCVTSPMKSLTWAHERACWLEKYLAFDRKHIISTSGKQWVHGHFLADDNADHCRDWQTHGARIGSAQAVLIKRSYNSGVHTLPEFVEHVRRWS